LCQYRDNAGIFPSPRDDPDSQWPSILSATVETVQKGLETNTYGPLRLCQAFIPMMQNNQYGRIVNLSSGMGQLSDMNGCCPGYRISRTALNEITRILADELKDTDILINSMCPGWVKTDLGGEGATRQVSEGAIRRYGWLCWIQVGRVACSSGIVNLSRGDKTYLTAVFVASSSSCSMLFSLARQLNTMHSSL